MGNIFALSTGGGFWLGIIVCFLADYKRSKKEPLTTTYKMGYFNAGYLFGFHIIFWNQFIEKKLYSELTPLALCILAGVTALALTCAYHIYYRKHWAWILGTILSMNWILWIVNVIYLSKYWYEIYPQMLPVIAISDTKPSILDTENQATDDHTRFLPSGCTISDIITKTEPSTIEIDEDRERIKRELAKPINKEADLTLVFVIKIIAFVCGILLYGAAIINGINGNWHTDQVIVLGIVSFTILSISILLYIIKNKYGKTEEKTINFKRGFLHLALILSIIAMPIFTAIIFFSENHWNGQEEAITLITLGPLGGFTIIWIIFIVSRFLIVPLVQYILDMFNIKFPKTIQGDK